MALEICAVCQDARTVPGPRNQRRWGYCRPHGLLALAAEDLIGAGEADELEARLRAGRKS